MVIAEVSIIPVGTNSPSVSKYVAKAIEALRQQSGVSYKLTAMGTLIEGELSDVLEAAIRMHQSIFDEEVKRAVTSIKIDDRRDKNSTIDYKVRSVMRKVA
jgi:uncharacterized protein (TIGR00106 family)